MMMRCNRQNNLYYLVSSTMVGSAAVSTELSDSEMTLLWHMRLGHISEQRMNILSERGLLDGQKLSKLDFCEHCIFGKQHKVKLVKAVHRTEGILDYVHSYLWGPAPIQSKGGLRYVLTLIDDFSRKVWFYFLKQKSDTFVEFKHWLTMIEKQTGKQVKVLRTDNGLEFCSGDIGGAIFLS
ncbi:hypothetical protein MLD38_038307 [Melastoma candidum]|uniref:Uncharacterized protein n=1 Tax=Melastoma candidum TaxID=119954 RepID=A0ACB9KZJ0_9MYRT|nr:hypothetical protein MLD38_038307 [Melastoma candidum]